MVSAVTSVSVAFSSVLGAILFLCFLEEVFASAGFSAASTFGSVTSSGFASGVVSSKSSAGFSTGLVATFFFAGAFALGFGDSCFSSIVFSVALKYSFVTFGLEAWKSKIAKTMVSSVLFLGILTPKSFEILVSSDKDLDLNVSILNIKYVKKL